jgi:hypothetical protein
MAKVQFAMNWLTSSSLRRKTPMLTTETIEKAIEMFEGGATDSDVAERTGVSPAEARAVANAPYLGETERLFREVALAGVLESAALALRNGRGLAGDGARDVVREIRHRFPNAGASVVQKGSPAATANLLLSTPTFTFSAGQPAYLLDHSSGYQNPWYHRLSVCSFSARSGSETSRSSCSLRPV